MWARKGGAFLLWTRCLCTVLYNTYIRNYIDNPYWSTLNSRIHLGENKHDESGRIQRALQGCRGGETDTKDPRSHRYDRQSHLHRSLWKVSPKSFTKHSFPFQLSAVDFSSELHVYRVRSNPVETKCFIWGSLLKPCAAGSSSQLFGLHHGI